MRIFTKSLLTFALLCVAGVVSAQQTVKGWFEVDVVAKANEARDHHRVEVQPARTIDGGYVIYARSTDDAVADGDMATSSPDKDKTDPANYVDWDTQFFLEIPAANAIPEGGKFRVRMKVKADEAISIGTQSHKGAGNYIHWACIGDVPFTDEWVDYDSGEKTADGSMNGFYCIAFNMGKGTENTYYFKDIVFEVYGDKPATPTLLSENMVWTPLIQNSDCEGTENTSFRLRQYPYEANQPADPVELVPGAGVDGSQGIKIQTKDMEVHEWDSQFWFTFDEAVPAGTRLRVKFDYRAENTPEAKIPTQAHTLNPGGKQADGNDSYNHYELLGDIDFTTDWQTFSNDNFVPNATQAPEARPMGSIAFNLNQSNPANIYYFDNVYVDKGALLNDVRNDEAGGIRILCTEYTNMPDLVKAIVGKKKRVVLPDAIAQAAFTVTVNGQAAPVESVEYDKDGSLYVFLPEDYAVDADAVVSVAFTNPTDEKYQLLYTRGDNIGNAVENFEQDSEYDGEIDIIPNSWLSPELETSDPENGSFCLPATIDKFYLTFDKPIKANLMKAKLDESEDLVVTADAADQAKVTLTRKSTAALAEGKHTINITRVYSVNDDAMYQDTPAELTFSVGEAAVDPKLQRALANAANILEESDDERFQGDAYAVLKESYELYDGEAITYTAPSQVQTALEDLSVKIEAQSQHFNRCKSYDTNLADAVELVSNYGQTKFAAHPLFQELATAVGKYEGKVLTDDDELDAANADLEANVKAGKNMFTEGESTNTNCGVKVLVERIRRGAETLKNTFNFTDDDELIVAANNAISDDDELANAIKKTFTTYLYERLAGDAEGLFSEEETDNGTVKNGPDMSVFVKNPNFYAWMPSKGVSAENTPGWPLISGNMGCWSDNTDTNAWGDARNIEGLPEDCAFTVYHANTRTEQTITDLPAGNYVVTLYGSDWGNTLGDKDEETGEYKGVEPQGFVYVKTSDTPAVEEGAEEDRDLNFAATKTIYYAGQYSMNGAHELEVEVKDGKLTIGLQFASDSQYFFSDVKLRLVGPAEGVDYTAELQKLLTGVETVKTAANSTVIYDLQGRRVAQPTKGLYIKNNKKVVVK